MKKIYISSTEGSSGINKYSKDFYNSILQFHGYKLIEPLNWKKSDFRDFEKLDLIHLEIGLNQHEEIAILLELLNLEFLNIRITLHDAPRIKYPYFVFKNRFLNDISKLIDIYFDNFGINKSILKKINKIYVLNEGAKKLLESKFGLVNVTYIPLLIKSEVIQESQLIPNNYNFAFFGFLDKNKGLEKALKIHQKILEVIPSSQFYIIGSTLSKKVQDYVNKLKIDYCKNVYFCGYVPNNELQVIFSKVNFVLLPFREYKFIKPTSASLLTVLSYNKIVFTNPVNSVPEIIKQGYNGFFLSPGINESANFIVSQINDTVLLSRIKKNIFENLINKFNSKNIIEILSKNESI